MSTLITDGLPSMPKNFHVAIMIDLNWPVPHHYDVYRGVMAFAREVGNWQCVLDPHGLEQPPDQSVKYDGVVARVTRPILDRARQTGTHLVDVWYNGPAKGIPRVFPEMEKAGIIAADHLLSRGFTSFGYLGVVRDRTDRLVRDAFRNRLREKGHDPTVLMVPSSFSVGAVRWGEFQSSLREWIAGWPTPIGVCTGIDLLARHLADCCVAAGLRVPHDVALIGSGNEPTVGLQPEPSLTTLDFSYEQVGWTAAKTLDRMMRGEAVEPDDQFVGSPELVLRQSTDSFAVNDDIVSDALRFISENSHQSIRVTTIASAIATTRRTLERRFRTHLDRTVAEEVERFRIERVKRQLVESDQLVKEIAAAAGFSDPKQMYKVFLKREGMSPTAYRESIRHSSESPFSS